MPQVLVRNIDEAVLERLKARAASHGRSLQAELKMILEESARARPQISFQEFLDRTQHLREKTAELTQTDSAELLREGRER